VLVCGVIAALLVIGIAIESPWSVIAGLVPLAIVLPVLSWLDRVEPEPRSSRLHALLWGGGVAIVVAGVVNATVAVVSGEAAAMLVSAPLIEEAAKGMGVYWAVRRRDVDGVTDGVVYAGWVALGFAVVEDMTYFSLADVEGQLVPVFVLRALLTPFAHPLFTFWIGVAIGRSVHLDRPVWPGVLWGYGLAVVTHAAWNGSLVLSDVTYEVDQDLGTRVILAAMGLFVVLFVAVAITLIVMRGRERRRFVERVPALVLRYGVAPDEAAMFAGWRELLRARRRLPRASRRTFDHVHAELARLAILQDRPGGVDTDAEQVVAARLRGALVDFRRVRRASTDRIGDGTHR
jgi:RsiW-degrading membrane proteinase PrsW (M82 family)